MDPIKWLAIGLAVVLIAVLWILNRGGAIDQAKAEKALNDAGQELVDDTKSVANKVNAAVQKARSKP